MEVEQMNFDIHLYLVRIRHSLGFEQWLLRIMSRALQSGYCCDLCCALIDCCLLLYASINAFLSVGGQGRGVPALGDAFLVLDDREVRAVK